MKRMRNIFTIGLILLLFGCLTEEEQAKLKIDKAIESNALEEIEVIIKNHPENDTIIIYGEKGIVQVIDNSDYSIFTDPRDGKKYNTIMMRDRRIWMAENMRYEMKSGSWCPDNKQKYCEEYGRLYNWENANKACPEGWYLPTDDEWWDLIQHYGHASQSSNLAEKYEKHSIFKDDSYWALKEKTKFSIQLSGMRDMQFHLFSDNEIGFDDIATDGYYWTSSEIPNRVIIYDFDGDYDHDITRRSIINPKNYNALSCRCLKNK